MGEAAVKVARGCGYVNAGTVEMLYQDGEFWFLEMNTRLQVEHCVTEEVTRLDLVAEQLRVASGEPLSFTQDSVLRRGHSIECRINAEDPATDFRPSPGTLTRLRIPTGPGVRWDGGYEEGDTMSQYFDNLIGKLVVWAPDRPAAIARALRALRELEISGLDTTTTAHQALLAHPDFAAAQHSTKWVEDELDPAIFSRTTPERIGTAISPGAPELTERSVPVEVNGKRYSVRLWLPEAPGGAGTAGSGRTPRRVARSGGGAGSGGGGNGVISAPMQGTIVKIMVGPGDTVEVGQAVIILEAMKMENHINAERSGTVTELRVELGATVGTGDVLLVIE